VTAWTDGEAENGFTNDGHKMAQNGNFSRLVQNRRWSGDSTEGRPVPDILLLPRLEPGSFVLENVATRLAINANSSDNNGNRPEIDQ
jgi:hypothetical protein